MNLLIRFAARVALSFRSFRPSWRGLVSTFDRGLRSSLIATLCLLLWGAGLWVSPAWAKTDAAEAVLARSEKQSIRPYLDRVIDRVTEFQLQNGIQFIVLERHQAPVVSFLTYADVGGVDEPVGKTGVAHFLEHLAFKGTTRIGTQNYRAEKPLLNRLDQLDRQIQTAKAAGKTEQVQKLQAEFSQLQKKAASYIKQNDLGRIVEQSGGVGLNAATSADSTRYFYSFPSNKLELWMSLESERFLEPVFREFFEERDVITEERRLRTDNSPIGKMIEVFLDKAFQKHPYRRPVIGYMQDIRNLSRADVKAFFEQYYVPSKLTIAVVGDVDPENVKRLATLYFGRYSAKPTPPEVAIVEPPQTAEREVTLQLPTQPWYLEGYHRPAMKHPDNAVFTLIGSLLSDGRTSRLYKALVEQKQVALTAQGLSGFPGDKYPNLMLFYALTAPGHTVDEVANALRTEIDRLKTEPVSVQDLDRVKTQAEAQLLRTLDSNEGMANLLVDYEVKTGSWRNLFKEVETIATITAADIQRVAQATFTPQNRTVGKLLSQAPDR
jgi:predicted Zn-dependent peptidase